jgi:hypothetical protein
MEQFGGVMTSNAGDPPIASRHSEQETLEAWQPFIAVISE